MMECIDNNGSYMFFQEIHQAPILSALVTFLDLNAVVPARYYIKKLS